VVNLQKDDSKVWRCLHAHPLVPDIRSNRCNVNGAKCIRYGTVRRCQRCDFDVCKFCWEEAENKVAEAEETKEKTRRGLTGGQVPGAEDVADLLHNLARAHEIEDGEMSGSDDGGDAANSVDDGVDVKGITSHVRAEMLKQLAASMMFSLGNEDGYNGNRDFDEGSDYEE